MADMESICARLCLLTRAAWKEGLPVPFARTDVNRIIRTGALEGLTLRRVPGVKEEHYARAEALLSRSCEIAHAVEHCQAQGYHILLPQDHEWPVNLRALGARMPQFLFVRGNRSLLYKRTVAVAGSRMIHEKTESIVQSIGKQIAMQGLTLVCGGARGVDTAVQKACLDSGGNLILVPAYPCSMLLRQEYLQHALNDGRLLIVCDTWPEEQFSAQKALVRNHAIYALGHAAIIAAARKGTGGTWRGAMDCLRDGYTPLFAVDEAGTDYEGTRAMIDLGARRLDLLSSLSQQLFQEGVSKE